MVQDERKGERPDAAAAERAEAARERSADEREHQADARERQANRREAVADERERRADERERQADERERQAGERQQQVDERERRLDERSRQSGLDAATLHQRTLEAIERARELLALSAKRLDRQEATALRDEAGRERDQAEIDRASADAERGIAALPPDPSRPIGQARVHLEHAQRALTDLAASRDAASRAYQELAALTPSRREEYRAAADREAAAARKARELLRALTE